MSDKNTRYWEMYYYVVFGRGDGSDDVVFDVPCTEEEYAILKKIENGDEAYEDYSSYEEIEELSDFVSRANDAAYSEALADMEEINDEEVDSLKNGMYGVGVRFDIW